MGDGLQFDFESAINRTNALPAGPSGRGEVPYVPPGANIGQSLGSFKKNYRRTVCRFWLKGLCMKGDDCGFLHELDANRMPVCPTVAKGEQCREPDCPYKHSTEEIPECNMYKLGFCIYGPKCRYRHTQLPGPPPDITTVDAAKPREFRKANPEKDDPYKVVPKGKGTQMTLYG